MSFRAAAVKAKQIAVAILRRRVFLVGKQNGKVPGRPQGQDLHLPGDVVLRARVPGPEMASASTNPTSLLLRSLVGRHRATRLGSAVGWRRSTALRLIESRFAGGPPRGGGGSRRGGAAPGDGSSRLPVFALLGLTLAAGEKAGHLGERTEADQLIERKRMLPLETCCNIIRGVFKRPDPQGELGMPASSLPSDLASYEISRRLLGKGACASIYAARLVDSSPTDSETSISEGGDKEEEDIAMETEEEDASLASEFGHDLSESWDELSDLQEGVPEEGSPHERYDLALKMMFNYTASTTPEIYDAFERECLPLWSSLDNGSFGLVRWENSHRAEDRRQPVLPAHPNLLEIHHAFVGATAVHDLGEARSLFPAALPPRLHCDGMGKDDTLYLVMRRYDMTLAEYNRTAGPHRSQRVAMVIIAQLLEGVAHLVHHGIAHRDLKSNNILVELTPGSPRVVIADFGFCLAGGLRLAYPDRNREIGGNSALMAPEVKLSVPSPTATIDYAKSDAWAVGAIAYEIMGLPNPFCRHSDGRAGLESGRYEEADLPELPDDVQPGLVQTIGLLLRKDPHMRPTASVAATLLHLFLWQPPGFNFASWEWRGQTQRRGPLSCQQQLATWLLQLSAGLLCQRSFRGGQRSWLDDTEYGLCMTFLARVTPGDLLTAANYLLC